MATQHGPLVLPLCQAAPWQGLLGENVPEDAACRGSLCSPTQSTYMTFTHMLPGASRRRVVPLSFPRRHPLLLCASRHGRALGTSQTALPACQGSVDLPAWGSDSSGKARTVNMSLSKKMRPTGDWPEMQRCVLSHGQVLSPLIYQPWQSQKAHPPF